MEIRRRPGVRGLWWQLRKARAIALTFFFPSYSAHEDQQRSRIKSSGREATL